MQQLDIFDITPGPPATREGTKVVLSENPTELSRMITNPMGIEMVVNDQIKVKVKHLKPAADKKSEAVDTAELIERIKAKLKREFDLTTPVERNDDDYRKSGPKKNPEASISSFSAPHNVPDDEELNKKHYYTMGQVSEMFHINQSMLRSWENEFDILKPKKNKKGDRYFRPADIRNIELIYHLLRKRKFTIEGAKAFLKQNKQRAANTFAAVQSLEKLKMFLTELKNNL